MGLGAPGTQEVSGLGLEAILCVYSYYPAAADQLIRSNFRLFFFLFGLLN
jgi:hypothetical protein